MIAKEYATALFELSQGEDAERIYNELELLCDAFAENPDAIKVLEAPNIAAKNKKEIIKNISVNMSELLQRFLFVLVDNERYDLIFDIKNEYYNLLSNRNDVINVDIISNKKLDANQEKRIKEALTKKFEGREFILNNIVDEDVIGGFKIIADGKCVDLSIQGKFMNLKKQL